LFDLLGAQLLDGLLHGTGEQQPSANQGDPFHE
jgi:hypothetical protein